MHTIKLYDEKGRFVGYAVAEDSSLREKEVRLVLNKIFKTEEELRKGVS